MVQKAAPKPTIAKPNETSRINNEMTVPLTISEATEPIGQPSGA